MQIEAKKTYTYEDYAQLPEGAPYQLIGGELVMSPAPSPYHQLVSMRLSARLFQFVQKQDMGTVLTAPVDVYLSEQDTPQPDILFIAKDRFSIIGEKKIEEAPDLVVEILSPSTAYYDLKDKKRLYAASGVKEYWIVDLKTKEIEVYENTGERFELSARQEGEASIASTLLKDFSVDLSNIF